MAGSIQVVVYWLWHPLFCRWIPMYCSNNLSAWAVISWASPLLNSHPIWSWKGLIFFLHFLPGWCSLPYFKLPLTLALHRIILSHSFVSCLHKHWSPEKGPFYFLVVYSLVSLDHFQSSLHTFSGFDWPLACIYTVIISYPYSADLDPEDGDSVFFYSVGIHVHYYMVSWTVRPCMNKWTSDDKHIISLSIFQHLFLDLV